MKEYDKCANCRWPAFVALLFASLFVSGRSTTGNAPLQSLTYQLDDSARQPNLLVMIRGLGAGSGVFAQQGLIDEVRELQLPFDVVAPDTHFGYYQAKTFEQRLKDDVIDPARRQGYRQIWLAGFSMGGLGALIYLRSYPEDIDGVLLTSPFLGWPGIHSEIRQAGGISEWRRNASSSQNWERMIWRWISEQDFRSQVPIWLGYGENDILTLAGPPLLATALPEERVFTVPGNHNVSTFKKLFRRRLAMLASFSLPGPFPESSGKQAPGGH